jgi:hypothetical protein
MGRLTVNYIARLSLLPEELKSKELLQPSAWSLTGKSKARSREERSF